MQPSTRRIVSRSPARTARLMCAGGLLQHQVEGESSLEADFVRRTALCPIAGQLVSQPFTLPVSVGGYTPDYAVYPIDGGPPFVFELKIERKVEANTDLFNAARDYLLKNGCGFYVLTEKHLRNQKVNERAKLLVRYAKAKHDRLRIVEVLNIVRHAGQAATIGSLITKYGVNRQLIYHLIATKHLTTGADLLVGDRDTVSVANVGGMGNENFFNYWFDASPWSQDFRAGQAA